ncbi:unnamed protein product, partial [Phaeothamnion confervicola]
PASQKVIVVATPLSYRKYKYVYGVAAGHRIVHHKWVERSILQSTFLQTPPFLLPGGVAFFRRK